jgi:hypothetical protein
MLHDYTLAKKNPGHRRTATGRTGFAGKVRQKLIVKHLASVNVKLENG